MIQALLLVSPLFLCTKEQIEFYMQYFVAMLYYSFKVHVHVGGVNVAAVV